MARYDGEKFFVDLLPREIGVDASCRNIRNILKQHESDVEAIGWNGSPGTGLKLLGTVNCQQPHDQSYLDGDILGPQKQVRLAIQILAERVLLLGAKALCEQRVFAWSEFTAIWHEAKARHGLGSISIEASIKNQSLRGTALFHCANECEELKEILSVAYEALDDADFQIVIANSRKGLNDCVFHLQSSQFLILVDIHSDEYRIFDCGGLIHRSGEQAVGN